MLKVKLSGLPSTFQTKKQRNMRFRYYKKIIIWLHSHTNLLFAVIALVALFRGVFISLNGDKISVRKRRKQMFLRRTNFPYLRDIISNYDFYYYSTTDVIKDFSKVGLHSISGFDFFPVMTPGLPEPFGTLEQYCSFLQLKKGDIVLDLGAYSGLSSIVFSQLVGPSGQVIAVEADPVNGDCSEINFQRARSVIGFSPVLEKKAIWNEETVLEFVAESNLGSAVKKLLPRSKSPGVFIPATTLSKLVTDLNLTKVDAIKADIEGSEFWAFSDSEFFARFHPTIIFEPAEEESEFTGSRKIVELLEGYGYTCEKFKQKGSSLPLIICR